MASILGLTLEMMVVWFVCSTISLIGMVCVLSGKKDNPKTLQEWIGVIFIILILASPVCLIIFLLFIFIIIETIFKELAKYLKIKRKKELYISN